MSNSLLFSNISPNARSVDKLSGLAPQVVDGDYLAMLGVNVLPSPETLDGLMRGSQFFTERLANGKIIPRPKVELTEIDLDSQKELSPIEQVAGQTYFIRKATDAGIAQVDSSRALTIQYEAFCQSPAAAWDSLREKMMGLGYAALGEYAGPSYLETANHIRVSAERWQAIQDAIGNIAVRNDRS